MAMDKGRITRQHTVWCGGCGNWEAASTRTASQMADIARTELKWRETREYGWVCRECAVKVPPSTHFLGHAPPAPVPTEWQRAISLGGKLE